MLMVVYLPQDIHILDPKKKCIQAFDNTIKLKQVNPNEGVTFMAAVSFSKNKKEAEIFLVEEPESIILTKQRRGKIWKNENYVLIPYKKTYQLKKDSIVIYQ